MKSSMCASILVVVCKTLLKKWQEWQNTGWKISFRERSKIKVKVRRHHVHTTCILQLKLSVRASVWSTAYSLFFMLASLRGFAFNNAKKSTCKKSFLRLHLWTSLIYFQNFSSETRVAKLRGSLSVSVAYTPAFTVTILLCQCDISMYVHHQCISLEYKFVYLHVLEKFLVHFFVYKLLRKVQEYFHFFPRQVNETEHEFISFIPKIHV